MEPVIAADRLRDINGFDDPVLQVQDDKGWQEDFPPTISDDLKEKETYGGFEDDATEDEYLD